MEEMGDKESGNNMVEDTLEKSEFVASPRINIPKPKFGRH